MEHRPVKSSFLESVAHDGDVLEVRFKNGTTYRYAGVNASDFDALLSADSVGRHFQQHFRPLTGTRVEQSKKDEV